VPEVHTVVHADRHRGSAVGPQLGQPLDDLHQAVSISRWCSRWRSTRGARAKGSARRGAFLGATARRGWLDSDESAGVRLGGAAGSSRKKSVGRIFLVRFTDGPKARELKTSKESAAAAAKATATRKARGTTSKKQKLAIHGNVLGVLVTPITAPEAPPAEPPPAAPPPATQLASNASTAPITGATK
jgi:hypothetical protein